MTTTPAAQQNTMATLMAMMKLDEQTQNDKILRMYRQEQAQKTGLAEQEMRRKQGEQQLADVAAPIFGPSGVTDTGVITPYAKGILAQSGYTGMQQPGATTRQVLPSSGAEGAPLTSPSGLQLPGNLINATPSPTDIQGSKLRARQIADTANINRYAGMAIGEPPERQQAAADYIRNQPFAMSPEQVDKYFTESQRAEQTRATIGHLGAQTEHEQALTKETNVKTAQGLLNYEIDSRWKEADTIAKQRLQNLDIALKQADLERKPDEALKLKGEIKKTNEEIAKLQREAQDHAKKTALINAYNAAVPGSKEANTAIAQLAIQMGHDPMSVLRYGPEMQKSYADLIHKQIETGVNIHTLAASGDAVKEAQARSLQDIHNKMGVAAALMVQNSPGYSGPPPTVRLLSVVPGGPGAVYGNYPAKTGATDADAGVGQAWINGQLLDAANKGQSVDIGTGPGRDGKTIENHRVLSPGEALASHISLTHSYMRGDIKGLMAVLNDSSAPQSVKDDAKNVLQRQNPLLTNVTVAPSGPEAKASGLSTPEQPKGSRGFAGANVVSPEETKRAAEGARLRSVAEGQYQKKDEVALQLFRRSYINLLPSQRAVVDQRVPDMPTPTRE